MFDPKVAIITICITLIFLIFKFIKLEERIEELEEDCDTALSCVDVLTGIVFQEVLKLKKEEVKKITLLEDGGVKIEKK